MAGTKRRYLPLLLVLVVALGAAWLVRQHGSGASADKPQPGTPGAAQARKDLAALTVAEPHSMAGYSREKFPHWIDQGDHCDTREAVLKRDGKGVEVDSSCHATAGTWTSRYDGVTVTDGGKLDIDHVVPLANAWRTGAWQWTTDQRERFANDLKDPQLVAVSAKSNRSKGDQDPSTWKPPSQSYWCEYASDWIAVKYRWKLHVTSAEKAALGDMLGHC
ncbi:HNH endonuclease family protein [Actinocatenispora rupis]|uniref:GmrSD restriction endonucleases C-terminal domain-containing protein n=1 Tax=Actinocatenispora rupis TaxID=519421 RepID=A0A8J3J905_9ACTN|nr:HNH endonuclease family protein [Actinocatenispora rupis]GID13921.1 hypothetical protein Aru02nite_48100 [Actinocatenispora rupis]